MELTYLRPSVPIKVSYATIMEQSLIQANPYPVPENWTPIKMIGLFNQAISVYQKGSDYTNPFRPSYYKIIWDAAIIYARKSSWQRKGELNCGLETNTPSVKENKR